MNWFTWLSRTGLDPSLIYDYALTFNENELGEDDIAYFNHEFLQSMGISIAKHRLEILKVSRNEHSRRAPHVLPWLKIAIKQTKNYFVKHVRSLVRRDSSKLSIVPSRNSSLRWKVSMLQRNKRPLVRCNIPRVDSVQTTLMLTNGSPEKYSRCSFSTQSLSSNGSKANENEDVTQDHVGSKLDYSFSSTMVHSQDDEYWSSSMEEIKWDSMFHNMKPT